MYGENAARRWRDLWGKRPYSYEIHCSDNKKFCRRAERRMHANYINDGLIDHESGYDDVYEENIWDEDCEG